jgi:hypothetical protein
MDASDLASVDDLLALAGMVGDGVVSVATARRMAGGVSWDSPGDVAITAAMTAMRLVRRSDRPVDVHVLATMALAVAEGMDGRVDASCDASRIAGLMFVVTAAEVLAEVPDRTLFQEARRVERHLMDAYEGHEQLGGVLSTIGSARLAPFALSPSSPSTRHRTYRGTYGGSCTVV